MEQDQASQEIGRSEQLERRSLALIWTGFFFALLQSICAFALAASGLRFAIGIGSLLLAGITSRPVLAFHHDIFRLPMLIFAVAASCINLALLWQVRWLRARPAAQWRLQPLSARQRRMEVLQFWLSIATLVLIAVEVTLHHRFHGVYLFWIWSI